MQLCCLCSPIGSPRPELALVICNIDRFLIDWLILGDKQVMVWLSIDRNCQDASNGGFCSSNGPPGPELAPVIGNFDRFLIDWLISGDQQVMMWLPIDRACQDASNGGLCSSNGSPEPESAPAIGNFDRFLIDWLILSGTKAMIWSPIDRSNQDASNSGLCSSNGLSGPELVQVIGKIDQLLIDLSILKA